MLTIKAPPRILVLQNNLQKLRSQLENTRPILPTETRSFTYQKTLKDNREGKSWKWVTEDSTVNLCKFGISKYERSCYELGQQIRETKDKIISLGYKPVEHGKKVRDEDYPRELEPREVFI